MKKIDLDVQGKSLSLQIIDQPDKEFKQWVPLKPLCAAIGIAARKQLERVQNDEKFSWHQLVSTGKDGKSYKMVCIPAEQVVGFLYTINTRLSQKPAVAKRLLHFQKYLQKAMNQVVFGNVSTEVLQELRIALSDLRNKYMEMEDRYNTLASRTDVITSDLASFGGRAMSRKGHLQVH